MQRTVPLTLIIIWFKLIILTNSLPCPCSINSNALSCPVTSSSQTINTSLCNTTGSSSINITYNGRVTLTLLTSSTKPIYILPIDQSDSHTLQIQTINTGAALIQINIHLSAYQVSSALFTPSSNIVAPNSILQINVKQTIADSSSFKIFNGGISPTINIANYQVIFDTTVSYSGTLYLSNLIRGLTNVTSITISGNNHYLSVDSSQIPLFNTVNRLALKNLNLYDRILDQFANLTEYSIEQCQYNKSAQFLNSMQSYGSLSLIMINNYPIDTMLPNDANAFLNLQTLTSITLIGSQFNSSCLQAIRHPTRPRTLILNLGSYQQSDFTFWITDRPTLLYLTINNITTLNIFPPNFFNQFDYLTQTTLQGTYSLEKSDICSFVGIKLQNNRNPPLVYVDSSQEYTANWDKCADTYIKAINQKSMADVWCDPSNSVPDCQRWSAETTQCDLISYESQTCPSAGRISIGSPFYYNNSILYNFFRNLTCLTQTNSTGIIKPSDEPSNIGAIIGAVCALVVAILVLTITIVCIRRYRKKDSPPNVFTTPAEKYKPSANDLSNVSIATSKSSKSSRYALEKSFFPPMQPIDEIAPPLYTATSDFVGSVSAYNLPSAPPAPRDSVLTHATTHLYETLP